jgi:hypothetical protein
MRWQQVGDSVVFDEGQTNPREVFDRMFTQSDMPASEPSPLEIIRARRGSVLDAALESARPTTRPGSPTTTPSAETRSGPIR